MKEFLKNLKLTWKYAKDQKWNIIKFLICKIISVILSVIGPLLGAKQLIALTDNQLIQLLFITLIICIINTFQNLINYYSSGCAQKVFRESYINLQTELSRNILRIENSVMEQKGTGVFTQRLNSDASRLSEVFNVISFLGSNILKDIGVYLAIFIISKTFFFYVIITVIVMYLIENKRSDKRSEKDKEARIKHEKITSFASEIVRGSTDIKMLNSENNFVSKLHNQIVDYNQLRYEMSDIDRKYNLILWFAKDIRIFCTVLVLIYLITIRNFSIATALILYNYRGQAFSIVNHFTRFLDTMKDFNLSSKRVFEIINSNEFSKEKFGTTHLDKVEGNFEFKNVHFSYDKNKVLKGINFKVNANETVAFVGKSGAGKTTIFNLLCKMYETNKGTITIDGINIKKLDKDSIRGNITIISQNPYIFNLSIKDNLKLVKEDLSDEEMIEACKMACLDEFIESLPEKYDTIIGEGGVNLSGGQKQRLAIARAFVQKTEIILFDEATSALDNETQSKIQQAIENLKKDYTILIIAHRLSTIVNSDRILLLNDGKIECEGTHEELLNKSEEYKHLYESEIAE